MRHYKLIIAGGRQFNSYFKMERLIDDFIKRNGIKSPTILTSYVNNADRNGARYAHEKDYKLKIIRTEQKYGVASCYVRNELITSTATHAIIFWSSGNEDVKDLIGWCEKRKVVLEVVRTLQNTENSGDRS